MELTLELTNASADVSVAQWLGLTSPQVVEGTLNLPDDVIANLSKYKNYILPGKTNLSNYEFHRRGACGDDLCGDWTNATDVSKLGATDSES